MSSLSQIPVSYTAEASKSFCQVNLILSSHLICIVGRTSRIQSESYSLNSYTKVPDTDPIYGANHVTCFYQGEAQSPPPPPPPQLHSDAQQTRLQYQDHGMGYAVAASASNPHHATLMIDHHHHHHRSHQYQGCDDGLCQSLNQSNTATLGPQRSSCNDQSDQQHTSSFAPHSHHHSHQSSSFHQHGGQMPGSSGSAVAAACQTTASGTSKANRGLPSQSTGANRTFIQTAEHIYTVPSLHPKSIQI